MGERIRFHDFGVRATDRSRDDAMFSVHRRLSVCLAWLKLLSGFGLLVIFAAPLVAQTNAATPDVGNALFEIPSRQYLLGDWEARDRSLPKRASALISSTSPTWKLIRA